jgi:hypothetical protein
MNREIRWNKYLIEAVVIVAAILLAFAIDAWWSSTIQNLEEEDLLEFLIEEIEVSVSYIEDRLEIGEIDQAGFREFYYQSEDSLASVGGEKASEYFTSFYRPSAFDLSQTAILGVVSSGNINLIQDPGVRNLLEGLGGQAARLQRRNDTMLPMETAAQIALGRHESYRTWNLNWESQKDLNLDLRSIRQDLDILGIANGMYIQRRIYMRFLVELKNSFEDLQLAVRAALA